MAHPDRIILLDNLDRIGLNSKHRNLFIENITAQFDWVISTCHAAFNYISAEIPALSTYKVADLLGFGNKKERKSSENGLALE